MPKRQREPTIVLAPAMTKAQVDHLQDLRRGSRSAPHQTARRRAACRTGKAGQLWKREQW
jgi:hypothetical protein